MESKWSIYLSTLLPILKIISLKQRVITIHFVSFSSAFQPTNWLKLESQITLIEEDIATIANALADLEKQESKIVIVLSMLWIYLRNFSIELLKIQNSMVASFMKLKTIRKYPILNFHNEIQQYCELNEA